jgi:hypothetical protein
MSSSSEPHRRYPALLTERRESTRFPKEPGTDFAVVRRNPGDERLVEVYDESLGGICVVMDDASDFAVGTKATLIYHHDELRGTVRHVDPGPDGRYLVGFECY